MVTCFAERVRDHNFIETGNGFIDSLGNEDTLSARQTAGFEDHFVSACLYVLNSVGDLF